MGVSTTVPAAVRGPEGRLQLSLTWSVAAAALDVADVGDQGEGLGAGAAADRPGGPRGIAGATKAPRPAKPARPRVGTTLATSSSTERPYR